MPFTTHKDRLVAERRALAANSRELAETLLQGPKGEWKPFAAASALIRQADELEKLAVELETFLSGVEAAPAQSESSVLQAAG